MINLMKRCRNRNRRSSLRSGQGPGRRGAGGCGLVEGRLGRVRRGVGVPLVALGRQRWLPAEDLVEEEEGENLVVAGPVVELAVLVLLAAAGRWPGLLRRLGGWLDRTWGGRCPPRTRRRPW